jgi:hypothetical protein
MQDYRKLRVWQEAHTLAVQTYGITEYFSGRPPGLCVLNCLAR